MRWREVDLDARVWSIPAERMKAKRPHAVPLSDAAAAILEKHRTTARNAKPDDLVFPGVHKPGTDRNMPRPPLSDMTLTAVLRRMAKDKTAPAGLTAHGFRSTARDWAGEATAHPRELAEHALAHVLGDKAEQAYRRGDALERRRVLMADWASYLEKPAAGVVDLAGKRAEVAAKAGAV
jgi:integrase